MKLSKLAADTARILSEREYDGPQGKVSLGAPIDAAILGTRLYRPGDVEALSWPVAPEAETLVEVTEESTLAAARRLVEEEGREDTAALNFASARNPGGGWRGEARSQEESIARASALVPCLESVPTFYAANRAERSLLYTDHLIYSPGVPVFRDDAGTLLPEAYVVTLLTSPAPNAGALRTNAPTELPRVRTTLARRARQVLKVAAVDGHRTLVLGAWGCGAFGCEPRMVAEVFRGALAEPEPLAWFEHVTFAIRGGHPDTLSIFRETLARA